MQLRLIRTGKKKKKENEEGKLKKKNTVTIKTDAHTIMCLSKNDETFSVLINAYSHLKLSFLCKRGQK